MKISYKESSDEDVFFGSSEEEEFENWMDELQLRGVNEYYWLHLLWIDIIKGTYGATRERLIN